MQVVVLATVYFWWQSAVLLMLVFLLVVVGGVGCMEVWGGTSYVCLLDCDEVIQINS